MPRLPQPGADQGTWGQVLNDYLLASHEADGSLKDIAQSQVAGLGTALSAKADTSALAAKADLVAGTVPDAQLPTRLSSSSLSSSITSGAQSAISSVSGQANGLATLDGNGKVPTGQLPDDAVTSVAGKTGAVTLNPADIIKAQGGPRVLASNGVTGTGFVEFTYTNNPNVSSFVYRDTAGRSQFQDPSAAQDAATKNYVDTNHPVTSVAGKTGAVTLAASNIIKANTGGQVLASNAAVGSGFNEVGYTSGVVPSNFIIRDSNSRAQVADPSAAQDIATKNYVDTASPVLSVAGRTGAVTLSPADLIRTSGGFPKTLVGDTFNGAFSQVDITSDATNSAVVRRDNAGRARFTNPIAEQDAATKNSSELTGDRTPSSSLGNVTGTLDLSTYTRSSTARATLTGNITAITLPTPASSESYTITLVLTQDATGSRTIAWGTILSAYGVDPVLTTAANAKDLLHLFWDGTSWWVALGIPAGA